MDARIGYFGEIGQPLERSGSGGKKDIEPASPGELSMFGSAVQALLSKTNTTKEEGAPKDECRDNRRRRSTREAN